MGKRERVLYVVCHESEVKILILFNKDTVKEISLERLRAEERKKVEEVKNKRKQNKNASQLNIV